jgi:hypothetical protein
MKKRTIVATVVGVVLTAGAASGAVALAGGGDDGEGTVTGAEADRAAAAAVAETGGTVNAVERDNETGATWEVEVKKDDGSVVDVRLDADYHVIVVDSDAEGHDTDA